MMAEQYAQGEEEVINEIQDIIKTLIVESQIALRIILILNLLKLILDQSQDFLQDIYSQINLLLSLGLPTTTNIFTWHLFHLFLSLFSRET